MRQCAFKKEPYLSQKKKVHLSRLTIGLIAGLILASCKPTTQLQVIQPAAIDLPDHIETLAIIDRSKPRSGFVNVLEGGFTGEGINQDKEGRKRAIEVLTATLTRTPRFRVVQTRLEYTGSETGSSMIDPLSWREIERICADFSASAVIALEMFDSDNHIRTEKKQHKRKDDDGNEYEETVFDASERVVVKLGWRIYDVKTQSIIDEVTVQDEQSDSRSGLKTEKQALAELQDPRTLTFRVSEQAGEKYAERIAPIWITVSRTFYKKSKGPESPDMERAARYFETDQWEDAAQIWQNILKNRSSSEEARGMAAYNLAVAAEKNGMLDSALEWAQKSYGEFGNKKARSYLETIQRRMEDQARLERQLKWRT
jgi:hypothetical protein